MAVRKTVVTIWVRHQGDCKYASRSDRNFARDCDCVKWLRYSGDACLCGYRHKGRQHRLSTGTRSWDVAEDHRADLQRRLDSGETGTPLPAPENPRSTVEQELETYLAAKQSENISKSVLRKLRYQLGLFCAFLADHSKFFASEITPKDVIEFRASWKWSDLTKIKAQQNLRGFIRAICRENRTDLLDALKTIKETKEGKQRRKPKPFSEAEIRTIMKHIPKGKMRTLVKLLVSTGLAIRDAVQLERSQIADGWLRLERQKTGRKVRQRLDPGLHAELLATLNGNPKYVFFEGSGTAESETKRLHTIMRGVMKAAKVYIKGDVFHRFRDTAVDFWLGSGWSMTEVAAALGDTLAVCERHYADLASQRMEERLARLPVRTWEVANV
jgi:integrase